MSLPWRVIWWKYSRISEIRFINRMIRIFNTVINIQYQTKPLKSITYFSLVYYWSTKICIPFDCILWGQILAVSSFPTFLIENRIGDCRIGYQTLGLIGVKKSDRKTIASYFFSFLIWKISTRLASSHCFPLSPLFFSHWETIYQ